MMLTIRHVGTMWASPQSSSGCSMTVYNAPATGQQMLQLRMNKAQLGQHTYTAGAPAAGGPGTSHARTKLPVPAGRARAGQQATSPCGCVAKCNGLPASSSERQGLVTRVSVVVGQGCPR